MIVWRYFIQYTFKPDKVLLSTSNDVVSFDSKQQVQQVVLILFSPVLFHHPDIRPFAPFLEANWGGWEELSVRKYYCIPFLVGLLMLRFIGIPGLIGRKHDRANLINVLFHLVPYSQPQYYSRLDDKYGLRRSMKEPGK